jgi:uncharacterized membrane protein
MKNKRNRRFALLALAVTAAPALHAAQIDVVATQTVTTTAFGPNVNAIAVNTTWTKDNVYILTNKVFVAPGVTLTIEAGTKIYSTLDDLGTGNKDDDRFGALVITRGARIEAAGTAEEPILFTTTDELEAQTQVDIDGDTFIAERPTATTYGRWGGVVVLGSAPITVGGVKDGARENRIEGFQPASSADLDSDGRADVIEYGGNNPTSDSGTLQYMIIRHGGYVYDVANNSEINGLTLGGVGSGTTINHIEVYANADDGIEFFGGSVNTSHMVMAFNQDDSFDIDEGYNGTNQFWFAVQSPFAEDGVASGHDNGGEFDGTTGTIVDSVNNSTPVIYNATFIGSGTTALAGNDKGNNAMFIDDRFRGLIYNSVFDDFSRDVIGSTGDGPGAGLSFAHNTVGRFGGGTPGNNLSYVSDSGAANTFFNGAGSPINGNSNGGVNPLYRNYVRDVSNNLFSLDPRPAAASPLWVSNGATLQAGAPVAVNYRGAFGAENWMAGWTTYDSQCYLFEKVDVIAQQTVNSTLYGPNVDAITVDTTWTNDKIYLMRDKVFVGNPGGPAPTLTIQPGTRIYSTLDDLGTGNKDDDQFGALVITRGARIEAAGTAQDTILFTTTDELEAKTLLDWDGDGLVAERPTATTYGRWGGVVVLGSAPITVGGVKDGARENRIEGFQPASSADLDSDGRADVIEYGGNNPTSDSGTLQYMIIRHGGYVYDVANNSEINGLTLGGVGSGTTINHIEVYANADDGIEFFGGSVNTSHMVMAFNQDDSFDIDEGYNGTNQFWFAVQSPFAEDGVASGHDNGGEFDGTTGTIVDSVNNSTPVIYNATFIGSGTTALAGNDKGNNAMFIDDRFRGLIYNSVFDDFSRDVIGSTGDGPGAGLSFAHNTVGRFGGGTPGNNLSYVSDSGAANTFFDGAGSPINGNSNGGVNPRYQSYIRSGDNTLVRIDPRPASNSPLLVSNGATLQAGAPVAVNFRGAFGSENWAAGWTSFSQSGALLGEAPATGGSFADADGDGISDDVEAANTALGFNPAVSNGTPATIFDGLYTQDSILDLTTAGQTIIQASGANVNLSLPVYKSANLMDPWTFAGNLQLTIPKEGDKQFYRIQVEGAQ